MTYGSIRYALVLVLRGGQVINSETVVSISGDEIVDQDEVKWPVAAAK